MQVEHEHNTLMKLYGTKENKTAIQIYSCI